MDRDRRRLLQAWCALGLAASVPAFAAPRNGRSSARTRSGRVLGVRDGDLHVFRGIRYGADTATGRFQPPRRETPWRGVREALVFGASAPQSGDDGPGSEDCLFLNVATPGLGDGKRRPILVYIHGGGFNNGSGSDPLYDGRQLCTHGDVVVVTVNHRRHLPTQPAANQVRWLRRGDTKSITRHCCVRQEASSSSLAPVPAYPPLPARGH